MNTNPNAKRILCFGDSNVWGYRSGSNHERIPSNKRWTGILQDLLGTNFEIIEEGLNSRTITSDDTRPGKEGRSSTKYIIPCLDSHDPIDLVILLLGTNELKFEFGNSPSDVLEELKKIIEIISERKSQFLNTSPKLLLLSPPYINEETEYASKHDKYKDANKKAQELEFMMKLFAQENYISFLATGPITTTGPDGIHLTEESHKVLAEELSNQIKAIYPGI